MGKTADSRWPNYESVLLFLKICNFDLIVPNIGGKIIKMICFILFLIKS